MSLPRFFLSEQILGQESDPEFQLRLDPDDAKHARVLRLKPGEHLAVIDASSDYFECQITCFDDAIPWVSITQHAHAPDRPYLSLFQGMAKADKMETVIRHATELGVCSFVPVSCARSVVKMDVGSAKKKVARWQSIAKSAAMQSGQPAVPQVAEPCTWKQALAQVEDFDLVLIAWEEAPLTCTLHDALSSFADKAPQDLRVALMIGPEGGITAQEVDLALASNQHVKLISLGSSILRTETAGIVAPALVLYELGGLGRRV